MTNTNSFTKCPKCGRLIAGNYCSCPTNDVDTTIAGVDSDNNLVVIAETKRIELF